MLPMLLYLFLQPLCITLYLEFNFLGSEETPESDHWFIFRVLYNNVPILCKMFLVLNLFEVTKYLFISIFTQLP